MDKTGVLKIQQVIDTYEVFRKIASQLFPDQYYAHIAFSDHFESSLSFSMFFCFKSTKNLKAFFFKISDKFYF